MRLLPRFGSVGQPFQYRVMIKNLSGKKQSDLTLLENLPRIHARTSLREWKAIQLADEKKILSVPLQPPAVVNPCRLANVREALRTGDGPESGSGSAGGTGAIAPRNAEIRRRRRIGAAGSGSRCSGRLCTFHCRRRP